MEAVTAQRLDGVRFEFEVASSAWLTSDRWPRKMTTFDDMEAFRKTPEAVAFAKAWIFETKTKAADCDHLVNLTLWQQSHPLQALGIILDLIELAGEDEEVAEMIAMGPATGIIEKTNDTFTPHLQRAIGTYPKFALFTKWLREHSGEPRWTRLSKP